MALTKVTGQVIKNTTDVTVGVLTVTNTLAVGGTVSIGGTLTYEDVTNVDAVGLITARNGIVVGSGITLSKDGDVFFTGIATGNGSGLTNLPAANLTGTLPAISGANLTNLDASDLASGTVPTARLGSGTASSSTFLRGDSTFQTVNTDLVSDTSPQLGGNLETNDKNIVFGDSSGATVNRLALGAGTDFSIYHNGTNTILDNNTGNLTIETTANEVHNVQSEFQVKVKGGDENGLKVITDGAVELYHDNTKMAYTSADGFDVTNGDLRAHLDIKVLSDDRKLFLGGGNDLRLYHNGTNSYIDNITGDFYIRGVDEKYLYIQAKSGENSIICKDDGAVELYHDNVKKFQTVSNGVRVHGSEGGDAELLLLADEGDDNADYWRILGGAAGQLDIANYATGSWVNHMTVKGNGNVTLPNQACMVFGNAIDVATPSNSTPLQFSGLEVSKGGMSESNSRSRITVPTTGTYLIHAMLSGSITTAASTDGVEITLLKNGSVYPNVYNHPISTYGVNAGDEYAFQLTQILNVSANDYLEICFTNINSAVAALERGHFAVSLLH